MLKKALKYAVLAVILYFVLRTVKTLGLHKTVYKHHPGKCHRIDTINQGSEDMERIPGDKVLITSGLRFNERFSEHYKGRRGRVFMFDFNYPDADPEEVTISNYPGDTAELDFHGIGSWVDPKSGDITVFIVNHLGGYDSIEIYTYKDGENTLYHKRSVTDDRFRLLNDVVAMSADAFYTTNYMYSRYNLAKLEQLFQMHWGGIVHHDGSRSNEVVGGMLIPNGISRSKDNRYIYVSHISKEAIEVYEIQKDMSLKLVQQWKVHTYADNIVVDDEDGSLWLGCHPVGYKAMLYMEDPTLQAPSQVLRLRTRDGLIVDMTEPFSDDGSLISGSAVGMHVRDKLLVGSIASQTVICDAEREIFQD